MGKYYYYKCSKSHHLNLSTEMPHHQLLQILELMSLPGEVIKVIQEESEAAIKIRIKNNKSLLAEKEKELKQENAKPLSIEKKWITNKINQDAYQRWYDIITSKRAVLTSPINRLSQNQNRVYQKLYNTLEKLSDLKYVYTKAFTTEKQELIRLRFDNNLYYQNGIYRTPAMIDGLAHNHLIMK